MNAHEYLLQVRILNRKIKNKMCEIAHLRDLATGVKAISYEGDKIKGSGDNDPLGHAIVRIVEMEEEINGLIDKYIDAKQEIIGTIDALTDADEYEVLYQFYVEEKSAQEIAELTHFSYKTVMRIKKKGLEHVSVPSRDRMSHAPDDTIKV